MRHLPEDLDAGLLEVGLASMDQPEIIKKLLFPRRGFAPDTSAAFTHFVKVSPDVSLGCRYYPARADGPNVLLFHGNRETAMDYDPIAPLFHAYGISLFIAEYRGYGMSGGSPTCSNIIKDALLVFESFASPVRDSGSAGALYVAGRSLGSAPAIEVAYRFQPRLKGLIVISGFASATRQIRRLGVEHLFARAGEPIGFGNDLKIRHVRIPTLIMHGEKDRVIPVEEGRELYDLCGAAQKTALFVPGAGHAGLRERALTLCIQAIARFTRETQSKSVMG